MKPTGQDLLKLSDQSRLSEPMRQRHAYGADLGSERAPQFSTPAQVAQRLRISLPTLYRLLRAGKLAGTKVGGQWRISDTALQKYLEDSIRILGN